MIQAIGGQNNGLELKTGHSFLPRSHYVERREDCKAVICPTNAQRSGETAATDGLRMGSANDSLLAADRRCSSVDLENIISPWVIPFASISLAREIGRGSLGRVYLGKWRETDVAIKMLEAPPSRRGGSASLKDSNRDAQALHSSLEREAGILASLRHPNIVMFMGVCFEPLCLVAEYCPRGSLADLLTKARTTPAIAQQLTWMRRLSMALETAKGMLQLHQHQPPILHNDLKTGNVLVDAGWHCKIADFNLSHMDGPAATLCTSTAENPRWMAPEVIGGGKHSQASDVYAMGIILWELLTWETPWNDMQSPQIVVALVKRKERPELPADPSALPGGTFPSITSYIELMQKCWAERPEERPSFEAVITELRALLEQCKADRLASRSLQATRQQSTPAMASPGTAARAVPLPPLCARSASEPVSPPRLSSSYNAMSDLEKYKAVRPRPVIGSGASMHRTMSSLTWTAGRYGETLGGGMSPDSGGLLGTSLLGDPVYMPQQWYEPLPDLARRPHFQEPLRQDAVQSAFASCPDRRDRQFGQVLQDYSDLFRESGGGGSMMNPSVPMIGSLDEPQGFLGLGGRQALNSRRQSFSGMSTPQYSRSFSGGRSQGLESWSSFPVGELDLDR